MANPTDLVKIRLQAEGKLPPGVPGRYSGALNAYFTIVKQVSLQLVPIRTVACPRGCYFLSRSIQSSGPNEENLDH